MKTLKIGIASYDRMKARTVAIARGEHKPARGEPTVWFTSIESPIGRVAAGSYPPAAPTDPDVPNSGIRLLKLCLRCNTHVAILRRCVLMASWPNVPAICPSASSTARSAASLHRVPSGQVPRLHRYYRPTPTSRLPSRLASSPSLGTTTACAPLRSHRAGRAPRGPGPFLTAAPAPPLRVGEDETSQVPGRPLRTCPALRPRRNASPRSVRDRRWRLPPCKRRRLREDNSIGTQSRGLHAPCVRFAAGVTPGLRNTRFRLGASLGRSGLSPAGSHRRFPPCLSLYMPSPFTKLRLAQLHKS